MVMEMDHYQVPREDSDAWDRWAGYFDAESGPASVLPEPIFIAYRQEGDDLYFSAAGPRSSVTDFPEEMNLSEKDDFDTDFDTLRGYLRGLGEEDVYLHLKQYMEEVSFERGLDEFYTIFRVSGAAKRAEELID